MQEMQTPLLWSFHLEWALRTGFSYFSKCKLINWFDMVWSLIYCCHLVETKCMSSESVLFGFFFLQVHWSSCYLLSGGKKGGTVCYNFKKDQAEAWQGLRPSFWMWDRTLWAQTSRAPQCLQTHSCHPSLPRLHSAAYSTALRHHSRKIYPSHTP